MLNILGNKFGFLSHLSLTSKKMINVGNPCPVELPVSVFLTSHECFNKLQPTFVTESKC